MKYFLAFCYMLLFAAALPAQQPAGRWWRARLHREDGRQIVFNFEWTAEKGKQVWYIRNASERIHVTGIHQKGDSLVVQMPLFESQFRIKKQGSSLSGVWIKGGAVKTQIMPFTATRSTYRFMPGSKALHQIQGRWAVVFTPLNKSAAAPAVAEFIQRGNYLAGTFLNPTGDYRYLEGTVVHDSLQLSCFDGSHAYLFTAHIVNHNTISNGWYYSGAVYKETWQAARNDTASLPPDAAAIYLRPGEEKLHFRFKDLDGHWVSIDDERFANKVVVVQLMGSWCPNCMDETAFLSDYYNRNRNRGVEIVSLAYEYSTNVERSLATLRKFQQRFNVQYPMLITGVTVNDSLRTEKTLPELSPIKFFPSSIVLDRKGRVRKLDTGFNGPATGQHYLHYIQEFEQTINQLLKE